jgi:hypothetical protein
MQDDLDRLIDGALSGYSNVEPLAGLEDRVLNRVRADASRRRRRIWILGVLAAPALVALVLAIPWRRTPAPMAVTPPPRAEVQAAAPAIVAPLPAPVPKVARLHKAERTPARRVLPKRDVFPTPTPLTREERLLLQLAASCPDALVMRPMEQIEIKPIEIAPLNIGGE